jgi:hypothetical protein
MIRTIKPHSKDPHREDFEQQPRRPPTHGNINTNMNNMSIAHTQSSWYANRSVVELCAKERGLSEDTSSLRLRPSATTTLVEKERLEELEELEEEEVEDEEAEAGPADSEDEGVVEEAEGE